MVVKYYPSTRLNKSFKTTANPPQNLHVFVAFTNKVSKAVLLLPVITMPQNSLTNCFYTLEK